MDYLLALTLLLAPAYAVRFGVFGLSTDALMVWIGFVWLCFVAAVTAKRQWREFGRFIANLPRPILIFGALFFIAGSFSATMPAPDLSNLGQYIALIAQPLGMFLIAGYAFKKSPDAKKIVSDCALFAAGAAGLLAIAQYFTLYSLPPAFWGNGEEPKRAIAFFSHPNFYALWAAPVLAFTLPGAVSWIKNKGSWIKIICWLLGAAGLFLSMSRAGWLGLAAAVGVYALVAADKKIRRLIFAGGVVLALAAAAVPNLRYRVILPFYGEKSAVSRLSLWQTGWKGVAESPITGLGLTGFARQWPVLNTDPNIDTHNFPHNIFLDMWVELGLAGLIGFIGLIGYGLYRGLHKRHRPKIDTVLPDNLAGKQLAEAQALDFEEMQNQTFRFALALAIIAILFQGLVDNPYFKNDLALVFWMLYAFI